MTEHVHEWNITGTPAMFVIVCSKTNCDAELTLDETEARLNEYETLKRAHSYLRFKYTSEQCAKMNAISTSVKLEAENETLKKATEALSAEAARQIGEGMELVFEENQQGYARLKQILAYADILEGK